MAVIEIRLCEADREEYGGPEVLTVDAEALKDLRAAEHQAIDEAIGMALSMFIPLLESGPLSIAHVGRIAAWLGLRNAGVTVEWGKFDPRLMRATVERLGDDTRPPDAGTGPSEDSSEEHSPETSSTPSNRSSASRRTSRP